MFLQPTKAIFSAARLLLKSRRTLLLMLTLYAGLLASVYLFVSTREATILQLVLTFILIIAATGLFFLLQAASVSYANGPSSGVLVRKALSDSLKLIVVSLPVIAFTLLAIYGLNRIPAPATPTTTLRYLVIGVVAPLLAIQLWVATSAGGLRSLLRKWKEVAVRTLAPQSVFVYACGFMIFAVAPYFLLVITISAERAWLEISLLTLRLSISALLILLGWVTTVGALSILSRSSYSIPTQE
jgi:hypothetical protein